MFIKITLVKLFLQIAAIQIFTRIQVSTIPADAIESQLINIREGQKLLSDELHEGLSLISDRLETNILERIKDVLCTGCKANTTTTTPTTTTTTTATTQNPKFKRSCKEWLEATGRSDKYLLESSATSNLSFEAYCLLKKDDKEASFWTVILRRKDGWTDFHRKWEEYQNGFGSLDGDFILGLDYIYALTQSARQELWIELENKNGEKAWAKYDNFRISNSVEWYELKSLGNFTGHNSRNNLQMHLGLRWSTKNVDNDHMESDNVASNFGGGWWFRDNEGGSCLTGYYNQPNGKWSGTFWKGLTSFFWEIKYAQMAIRPFGSNES